MMNKKSVSTVLAATLAVLTSVNGVGSDVSAAENRTGTSRTSQTASSAKMTEAMQFVCDMGIGINLGNTFESCGDWINGGVKSYETAWGSPVITEKMIKGYKDAGFSSLRVPVAWSNMLGKDYTVSREYIAEVKKVVDWALKYDMYVIINLHYDSGWLKELPTKKEECMKRYKRIWEQVSDAFKNYDNRLIFEGQNEELGWSSVWNPWGGTKGKKESYELVNEVNQTFVDVVRASGGKNDKRYLLIPGYNTDIDKTVDPLYKVPEDKAKHLIVSVHYYSPADFAILTKDESWGKNRKTWGTDDDIKYLNSQMDALKKRFLDSGIPVIIGEYGCPTENKDIASVRKYISKVCESAYVRGMCPMLWSTTGNFYDRSSCRMMDDEIAKMYKKIVTLKRDQL